MSRRIRIEACIASVEDAIAASEGGADRLELNTALSLDGLTPSIGLLREVKEAVSLPIIVMIRPRPLGFQYTRAEFAVMQADVDAFLHEGVAGFAFGILAQNNAIDIPRTRLLTRQIGQLETVFHRAFDVTPHADEALQTLIDLGIRRILTSGHMPTALEGATTLKKLQSLSADQIEILPGSGIKPTNVATLLAQTDCNQVHGTFRPHTPASTASGLDALRTSPHHGTNKEIVRKVREIVDGLS